MNPHQNTCTYSCGHREFLLSATGLHYFEQVPCERCEPTHHMPTPGFSPVAKVLKAKGQAR